MFEVSFMCQQLDILEKIREKGRVNGYDIDLAEAQARDYIRMDKKVGKIEKDVGLMKKDMRALLENQARQGGQIDAIERYITSPAEQERKEGIVWHEFKNMAKNPLGKMVIVLILGSFALAGQRILELLGLINN